MVDFTLWDVMRNLLLAARWTVALSLIAFVGGGLLGGLLVVARVARWPGAERLVGAYVQVFQGTPLLMQLFLAYFGLALLGLQVSAWAAASLALTLYASAFLAEIWRGCILAVPKGQWEASASLALLVALVGFCMSGAQTGLNAYAPSCYPTTARATGVSWMLGVGRFGSIFGSMIGGVLLGLGWQFTTILSLLAIPAALAAVAVTASKRN